MTIPTVRAKASKVPFAIHLSDDLGHEWLADEPADNGGANAGPTPNRLLLSSLGACTAITLQMYAARKQWPVTGVEVELQFNPHGTPAAGNDISRHITLQGPLSADQRERLLQIANACPMHKVLTGEIRIATELAADA